MVAHSKEVDGHVAAGQRGIRSLQALDPAPDPPCAAPCTLLLAGGRPPTGKKRLQQVCLLSRVSRGTTGGTFTA